MIEKIFATIQNLILDWHSYIKGAFGWKNIFDTERNIDDKAQ